jgi:hypothetical protein
MYTLVCQVQAGDLLDSMHALVHVFHVRERPPCRRCAR